MHIHIYELRVIFMNIEAYDAESLRKLVRLLEYENRILKEKLKKENIPSIPDSPEAWLDEFNTFSIYQVLPQLIELWGLNVKTDIEAKKNFVQQNAR